MTSRALTLGLGLVVAPASAADGGARREAVQLETELRFPEALDAWARCAAEGPPRDQAVCARSAERLRPQAADGYTGWTVLTRVRRDYRTLGSAAAAAEIQAALDADPGGPAAADLRRWLVAEALEHGRESPHAPAVAAASPDDAAWVREATARVQRDERHRAIGIAGAAAALVYAAVAALGRPAAPLAWRSAAAAFVALGLAPLALAAAWDAENTPPFLENAAVIAAAVLGARRAPPWLGALGTFGALTALAWRHGWLAKLGVP